MPPKRPLAKRSFDHMATADLWRAMGSRDAAALRKALGKGGNPNARSENTIFGRATLLQEACKQGDEVAVRILLEAGARQVPGRHAITPLIQLALSLPDLDPSHAIDCFRLLLEKKPNLYAVSKEMLSRGNGSAGVYLLRAPPTEAAAKALDLFLGAMKAQKKVPREASADLLFTCFHHGTPVLFERLVEAGADPSATSTYALGLAGRLLQESSSSPDPSSFKQDWWDTLARHHSPPGHDSLHQYEPIQSEAQEELARRRAQWRTESLESSLPEEAPSAPRLRM